MKCLVLYAFLVFLLPLSLEAQNGNSGSASAPPSGATEGAPEGESGFEKEEFPLWANDLRRADIITFGAVPFTIFFTGIIMDRIKPDYSKEEPVVRFGIGIAAAVGVAVIDHIIIRIKRAIAEKERQNLPEGEPIIIKRPIEKADFSLEDG